MIGRFLPRSAAVMRLLVAGVAALPTYADPPAATGAEPPAKSATLQPPPAKTAPPQTQPAVQVNEAVIRAPLAEVWRVFSTAEGFKQMGVAKCDMDFRIGGQIRTHYNPGGVLGDEGTIVNEILAYEPERMLAIRVQKPPAGFPFPERVWRGTWSVIGLADLGDGRTHVRIAGYGYTDDPDSQKMRRFFEQGNAWVLQKLQAAHDAGVPAPRGPAHAEPKLAPLQLERVIEAPRAAVWELLSTPAGWRRMLDVPADIELRPGGKFEIRFATDAPPGAQGSEGCRVLSLLPGEMLSFTWNAPPQFAAARERHTWVVIQLDQLTAQRTRVRLTHHGFAEEAAAAPALRGEWEQVRGYFQNAWGKVLERAGAAATTK